ncbi:MAG: hypothetical protein RIQ88_934, partial [Actinomycetota bacterium]
GGKFKVSNVIEDAVGIRFDLQGLASSYKDLFMPLHGTYQAENAAVAVAAVEQLMGSATAPIPDALLRAALADVSSPGRLQVISKRPTVLLDAAHNPHGARSLAKALDESFGLPEAVGILSILADKDARGLLSALEPVLTEVILTQSSSSRATDLATLLPVAIDIFGEDRIQTAASLAEALPIAKAKVSENGMVVISGSITLIGDALKLKQKEGLDG